MKCPNCDRENRDVARFCQYCGAVLTAVASADVPPEETQAAEGEPSPAPSQGSAEEVTLSQENEPEAPGRDLAAGTRPRAAGSAARA
jgi:hypothetical protein